MLGPCKGQVKLSAVLSPRLSRAGWVLSWDATSIARWLQRSLIRKLACLYREQMQSSTVLHCVLETELAASTVSQRALSGEQSAAVLAAVQSKHDFRCLKQNSIYKEYSSSGRVASRPASGRRPAKSDGRMCVTLCVEDAASQQQRPQTGVWCPVSGTPYTSLGQIQHLELKLPVLYRDQAEAARAAKALAMRMQQAAAEEQHAAAARHLEGRLSGVPSSQVATSNAHHRQTLPEAMDPDDEWLASLDPHLQALLIKKQPVCLTRADHMESRFPQSALQLSQGRYSRCHSRTSGWSSPIPEDRAPSPLEWGEGPPSRTASTTTTGSQHTVLHQSRGDFSSCQPCSQPDDAGTCKPMTPQPCRQTQSCSPALTPDPVISSRFRTATFASSTSNESPESGAPSRQQVPRRASVSMRARSRDTSRVTSHMVASAALPDALLQGGFPKAVSSRSCLNQYDTTPASLRRNVRLHSRNSRPGSAVAHACARPPAPAFTDLVKRPRQAAGASSPAFRSQRAFLAGRQQQRHELQTVLWERAERRSRVHEQYPLSAACCHLLLKDLASTNGHRPAYCIKGLEPPSLVEEAEKLLHARTQEQSLTLPPLELTDAEKHEVEAVVSFYEQLCQLAQKLKALDPFCMLFLQQVKQGLETGVSLKPVLLITALNKVAHFAQETGMLSQLAPRLFPLCTFVCKAVKLQERLLLHHARRLGITELLCTPDQLQALAQPLPGSAQPAQGRAKSLWSQIRNSPKRAAAVHQKSTDALRANADLGPDAHAGRKSSVAAVPATLSGAVSKVEQDLV